MVQIGISYNMAYNPNNPNGSATSANSAPVVIASDQAAIPITDNAGSITVDGSVSVSNFPATQPISGTVDTELPTAASLSDATANPTAPIVGAANIGFNGTTWDRIKTQDALSGNSSNDTVNGIMAVSAGPGYAIRYNPTNLATAANSASTINVEGANSVTFAVSTTTTGTITFEATADNTNWINVEVFDGASDMWVSGQSFAPTAGKVYQLLTQGYRQVRMRTVTTLGATVSHFVTLSTAQQFLGGIDTGPAPHNFGYTVMGKSGEYTTTQTGVALWTPTTGRKFVISDLTISTGGTTSGIVTVWQGASGDTTYTAGTDPVLFRGEFSPSATAKPGVVKSLTVPFVSTTTDHILRVTTSDAMTIYIQVNGYEII